MRSSKFTVALAREALAARSESAQGWLRGTAAGRTTQRVLSGFAEAEWADRSMTLAAQSFTSVLPVAIVASSLGNHDAFTRGFFDQFGIDVDGVAVGVDAAGIDDPSFAAFGIVGVLMVLIGGTSFARALGRMYGRIWKVPTLRFTSWWRWIAVLLSMGSAAALIGVARTLDAVTKFGALELVFTALGWMFVAYGIVVGATVLTKAFALDEGPIGRLLRGPTEPVEDVPAATPAHTDPH